MRHADPATADRHDLESLRLLSTAIEQARETVVVTDRGGAIQYVNPAFTRMTGYPAEEALGRNPRILASGEHAPDFYRRLWETILAGRSWSGEIVNRRKDGTLYTEEMSITPVCAGAGDITHFVAIKQDVSARKQVEAELRRTQFIMDHIGDMILWVDVDGWILYANEAAARSLGYAREELLELRVGDIDPALHSEGWRAAWESARQAKVLRFESSSLRKDGSTLATSVVVSHLNFRGRDYQCAVVRDITDAKAAEERLRAAQERLRNILEHSTNLFYSHTPDHRLTYVSPQARHFFGCDPEEAMVRWMDFLTDHPVNAAAVEATERAIRTGERQPPYEVQLRTRAGRTLWVEVNEAPVRRDGRVEEVVGSLTDITARKEAERQREMIEERMRMSQRLEAVGQLAGGVAHDFNNLLSVINGYGEMLLGSFAEADPRRARIEEIVAAGRRAVGLTGQLLAFSRRQIAEPRVVDLNALIGETEKILRRLIGDDIVLDFARGPGLGHVRIDPVHLDQVLINLAVNARDAMPGGGTLRIETANAEVGTDFARLHPPTEPGRYVVLSMTDTGTGMDTETQQHAFEPFYTTKGTGKGTGLGLATVYGIVKQSGGYVWIESATGKGTCFRIYLPLVEAACDPIPAAAPDSIVGGSETILVVEDNAPLRDLVRDLAQELGYSVLSAANGQEAIEVAARHPGQIDLMLTDVIMPGMSARELARALRAGHPDLKVLYMSGYSHDVLGSRNALDPDVRLIAKPIGRVRLAGALRQVLDGHPDRAAKAA